MTPILRWLVVGAALFAGACDDQSPRMPTLLIEKYDAENDCFYPCSGQVADEVRQARGQLCPAVGQSCRFSAGTDQARVTVDYGTVPFALTTAVTLPTLSLRLGDKEVPLAEPLLSGRYAQMADHSSVYFSAVFYVPSLVASTLQVLAKSGEGFAVQSELLPVSAPSIALSVANCMGQSPCSLWANVGSAQLQISTGAAFLPAQGRVSSRLDGVELSDNQAVELVRVQSQLRGKASLPVPVPNKGWSSPISSWEITATFGSLPSRTVSLQLTRPPLSVVVRSCPAGSGGAPPPPCALKAGTSVVVDFTAPAGFNEPQGTLTTSLDGIPTLLRVSGGFANSGFATATYSTALSLPSQPGSVWMVQGQAGPYIETSAPVTLLP